LYRLNDRGIFIAHPKIASRSIQRALQPVGWAQVQGRHDIDEAQIEQVKAAGGTIACCVRNPYDVFISWYYHGVVSNAVRTKRYGHITPFTDWLPGVLRHGNGYIEKGLFYGSKYCDTIIRYETLLPDLNAWLESFEHETVELPMVGKATARNSRAYQTFYDGQTEMDVRVYAAKELEEFGYEFDQNGEYGLLSTGLYGRIE